MSTWKCMIRHILFQNFLGGVCKQRNSRFSTGSGPGRPKLAAPLVGWPWLFKMKDKLPTAGAWHINTCLWNKWTSLVSHSHSVFYPKMILNNLPSSSRFLIFLRSLEKEMQCHVATLSQRVQRTSLGAWESKSSWGSFRPQIICILFHGRTIPLLSMFLIHKAKCGRHWDFIVYIYPLINLRESFLSLERNSLSSDL